MSHRSLDSQRPLMDQSINSKRASIRYSTYSTSPSFASTTSSTTSTATNERVGMQEIRQLTTGLQRLENKPLNSQRVQLNEEQTENMKKIALGAKLDRALGRRMTNQDAIYRPRPSAKRLAIVNEKAVKA